MSFYSVLRNKHETESAELSSRDPCRCKTLTSLYRPLHDNWSLAGRIDKLCRSFSR